MAKLKVKHASCWASREAGRIALRDSSQACEDFRAAMAAAGITWNGQIVADGKLRRFKAENDHARNSWYVLHSGPPAAGAFGCFKRDFKDTWCERNGSLSQAEWQHVRRRWQIANQERERVETQLREKARKTAAWIYERANPVQSHAYLEAKRVQPFGELRESYCSELLLPLRDINGELHSLQFIAPDKRYEGERNKNFLAGGRVSGCFYTLADKAEGPLIICEGYATGASIHEPTGHAVFCAMNSGNLLEVAKAARERWPQREIIIAADNDQFRDGNPGLTKGTAAAKAIRAKLTVPQFKDLASKPTDFNDLAIAEGFDAVREQIGSAQIPTETDSENSPQTAEVHDEETIARLAALPVLEYERCREAKAKTLGCRALVLDKLVEARRSKNCENNGLQGTEVKLIDVEPWPEPVNGAEILDAIARRFSLYIVLPEGAADTLSLWCAHTHVFKVFEHTPRAIVSAPMHRCGKTITRNLSACFCNRALKAENLATAVVYRLIDAQCPTILADEFGGWLGQNEELQKLLNSGHEKGGVVLRCVGDNHEVRAFAAFAPIMLCGIGALPVELHDRAIVIRLKRAKKGEVKARFDSRYVEYEHELNRKLARWCNDNRAAIEACEPRLPERSYGRDADNWRPLFAIAEIAGGDWPQRCADAYAKLTGNEEEIAESLRMMLLADIREVFKGERIFSKDLTDALHELKERPWLEANRGKPITERWLARNLAAFGIRSGNIRIGEEQAKGYERTDFDEVFSCYLPDPPKISVPTSHTEGKTAKFYPSQNKVWDACENAEKPPFSEVKKEIWDVGTGKKGDTPENADFGERDAEAVSADADVSLPDREPSAGKEKLRL